MHESGSDGLNLWHCEDGEILVNSWFIMRFLATKTDQNMFEIDEVILDRLVPVRHPLNARGKSVTRLLVLT